MKRKQNQVGFALPTVVVTSIIMMIVLLAALTATSSVQAGLRQNYYDRVARNAAESGSIYAEKCLVGGDYAEDVSITPNRNCNGSVVGGLPDYIVNKPGIRSTFSFKINGSGNPQVKLVDIESTVEVLGKDGGAVARTIHNELKQRFSLEQNEDEVRATKRYWYLGRGVAFDFKKSGNARTLMGRADISASEGSTTVTDKSGNILFWSNGSTIWNKNGAVMQNGSGLKGANSATQAVAAFPLDSNYNKIGVVSNNSVNEGSGSGELYYSVVDMTLRGNLGEVTTKNQRLGSTGYAHEGIGAIPSNRQGEFWVYAYSWSGSQIKVTRFRVGVDGVTSGPSAQYFSPGRPDCSSSSIGYGTFNFSNDYNTMLLFAGQYRCSNENSGRAYILKTNPQTGALTLSTSWITSADEVGAGYSADFSPNEKYVYVTNIYPGKLMRYSIESYNESSIRSSKWVEPDYLTTAPDFTAGSGSVTHESGGQVLRGPDERMYIADQAYYYGRLLGGYASNATCYMSVINRPNETDPTEIDLRVSGSSGSVELSNGTCSVFGLPQMATVYEPRVVLY